MTLENQLEQIQEELIAGGTMKPQAEAPDPEEAAQQQEQVRQQKNGALDAQLGAVTAQAAEAKVMARLLQDPDFAKVMQLKAQGKAVKFGSDEIQAKPPPEVSAADLDSLKPSELVQHIVQQVTASLKGQLDSGMTERLGPITEQLTAVSQTLARGQVDDAKKEIDTARQELPDLDQFLPAMSDINKEAPNLSVKELYVLAKVRAGSPLSPQRGLESERPTVTTARPPSRKQPLPQGRQGIRMALDQALSRVTLNSQE